MKLARASTFLIFFAGSAILALFQCGTKDKSPESFFLNLNDTVGYVGIDKCRTCHAGHYETFMETGMGKSFGPADKAHSKSIIGQTPVYDPKKNMYYAADWVNNQLRITEFRLKGKDTVHKRSEFVKYIIGSGHHTNSHLWEDNGFLFQAPLTWYSQKAQWDLPPGFESTNTGFSRKIDMECMSCHNAMPMVEENSVNKFTKIPSGIDCERCHGPGELHVQLKQKGEIVDVTKNADRSIVNPSRLPWKLQVDVCQRCHLQGNNVLKEGKTFADFRPGMPLSDVFDVYMPTQTNGEFFMAGHSERLQMSACFKNSNNFKAEEYNPKLNFTCITCHNPHVSVKKTNTEKFNAACKNCHQENGASKLKKCIENSQKITAKNNNCVACHMPSSRTQDIPHVSIHDHYIRKKYDSKIESPKTEIGLYAVNETKPDKATDIKAYITWFEKFEPKKAYLEMAKRKISEEHKFISTDIQIHFFYANEDWNNIIKVTENSGKNTKDAWTMYRIGKAYDRVSSLSEAVEWYKMAWENMSLNIDFGVEYANSLLRNKRIKEAEILLKKLLQFQSKNDLVFTNLGSVFFNQNKIGEAKNQFLKAIALNPDQLNAHLYLGQLYVQVGEKSKAIEQFDEVARIQPKYPNLNALKSQLP